MRIAPCVFGQQADDLQELADARLARCGVADAMHVSGSARISPTVMRGLSEA